MLQNRGGDAHKGERIVEERRKSVVVGAVFKPYTN